MKKALCISFLALLAITVWGQRANRVLYVSPDSSCKSYYYVPRSIPDLDYRTFRYNCMIMSMLKDEHKNTSIGFYSESMRGRFSADISLLIPDGVPLYCPVEYTGKRCNLYVLQYKKVYRFGEPCKEGTPDTIECMYEYGMLKSVKEKVRLYCSNCYGSGLHDTTIVYILRYRDRPRQTRMIASLACYGADGQEIFSKSVDLKGLESVSCRKYQHKQSEYWKDYGEEVYYKIYYYDNCKVTYESYSKYETLTKKGRKYSNTWDRRGYSTKSWEFTALGAYKPSDGVILEYEIIE